MVFRHALVLVEEFIVKGKDRMPLTFGLWELLTPLINFKWHAWIGAAIFLWGWIHQRHCHAILVSLHGLSCTLHVCVCELMRIGFFY